MQEEIVNSYVAPNEVPIFKSVSEKSLESLSEDYSESTDLVYVPIENIEEEIVNFVFDGVNPSNLNDTTRVKLKSFTFKDSGRKANSYEVWYANNNYKEKVIEVYKFHSKYDKHIYTKSIGIETPEQILSNLVEKFDLDLVELINDYNQAEVLYEPGTEEYDFQLYYLAYSNMLPSIHALKNIMGLVSKIREDQDEYFKTTYTGNKLEIGFYDLAHATNNVAFATIGQANATACAGAMQAQATQAVANEAYRANDISTGGSGRLGPSF